MAEHFNQLATAPSREAIVELLDRCYRHRADASKIGIEALSKDWDLSEEEMTPIVDVVVKLIGAVLYLSAEVASSKHVVALMPEGVEPPLASFVGESIVARLPLWREGSIRQRVSLPKLVEVDWRVDVKSASEGVARMTVPTVLMDLKTQRQPTVGGVVPGEDTVSFELSKETLNTMLAGLSKIRDQLATLA